MRLSFLHPIHYRYDVSMWKVVVDSHIQRFVLATEKTTVTQQASHTYQMPIPRSQRGTKVNGSHHPPVLSTYLLRTNDGWCGKKRRILIGPCMVTCQGSTRLKLPGDLPTLCRRALGSERHRYTINCVTQ